MLGNRDRCGRAAPPLDPLSGARLRCLRLYHAAPSDAVPAILRAGLAPGDVALTPAITLSAVWLTSDARACAELAELERDAARLALLGFDPAAGLRGVASPAPAVLAVRVPGADRRLVRWAEWAPRHLPPLLRAVLSRCGAVRTRAWFLYRGPIPPAWIAPMPAPAPLPSTVCARPGARPCHAVAGAAAGA